MLSRLFYKINKWRFSEQTEEEDFLIQIEKDAAQEDFLQAWFFRFLFRVYNFELFKFWSFD